MTNIRDAQESDLESIRAIYNHVLTHSTAIYNDRPATLDDRKAWWRARVERGYPVLVAAEEERVAGFASFGDFRAGPGYRFTVESTIHVDPTARGRGIGTALLGELVGRARTLGKHVMIAGVDSENVGSLQFLERNGFVQVGHLGEVGFKFGRFLSLIFLQLTIDAVAR